MACDYHGLPYLPSIHVSQVRYRSGMTTSRKIDQKFVYQSSRSRSLASAWTQIRHCLVDPDNVKTAQDSETTARS